MRKSEKRDPSFSDFDRHFSGVAFSTQPKLLFWRKNTMNPYLCNAEIVCFANDNTAFVPEQWAYEGLMQLEEQMVVANLVHRDFEDEIAAFGDTVNTRRPGEFKIRRKNDTTSSLDKQDASATNVAVKLNQWFYNSFVIKDGEQSKSFKDLLQVYLVPSMRTIARSVDRALLGHIHKFLSMGDPAGRAGRLENLPAATSHEMVLEAREKLNSNNAPLDEQRSLILSSMSETALLKNEMFIKANERGDGGAALEDARLGRILGFNTFLAQNVNYVNGAVADTVAGAVTGAEAAGEAGSLTVTLASVAEVGEFINVAGNDQPTWATAVTATTTTTAITLNEPLKYATSAGAVLTQYKHANVEATYAANYDEQIEVSHTSGKPPQIGQLLAFGTGGSRHTYTIIEVDTVSATNTKVMLDRPLDISVNLNDSAYPGPAGSMNWAMHRECVALVSRPLAVPANAMGVLSGVGAYNDIAMRVSMQYDIDAGGTVVNCDILAGIKELDENLAVTLLG
jgi:hypothetical protein